jgi:hypothetical protein
MAPKQDPKPTSTWTSNKTMQSDQAAFSLNHDAAAALNDYEQSNKPIPQANLSMIGGIGAGDKQWLPASRDSANDTGKNNVRTKKLYGNPASQLSPITGEVIQNSIVTPLINRPSNDDADDDPDAGLHPLVKRFKDRVVSRGSSGIIGLQRKFRIMDDDGSKSLNMVEFKKAMKETVPEFSDGDATNLFRMFGKYNICALFTWRTILFTFCQLRRH